MESGRRGKTSGKRLLPTAMKLKNSALLLPHFIESHEQPGKHPLLVSSETQAKLGSCKDMREGTLYLKDYDDYIDLHRAKGSGLVVVCVSHFPTGKFHARDFVQRDNEGSDIHERCRENNEKRREHRKAKTLRARSGTSADPANADCLDVNVLTACPTGSEDAKPKEENPSDS